jgi:serine/threonine protein kinase
MFLGPAPIPEPGSPQPVVHESIGPSKPRPGGPLAIGELVADTKYRIVRFIGDGGMGAVYEAEHIDLERRVALKILQPELSDSTHAIEMFRTEARTVSKIGADEIVQLYDFAELPDGRVMFTMELLDGPTLAEAIEQEPLSPSRIITLLRRICSGLAAAHAAGVIHRDIKPDNIVLDRRRKRECVKILDFGIATMLDDASSAAHIQAGTPMYVAPELIKHEDFDHRADIYSLGCVAYEMCSGAPPFPHKPGESPAEVLRQQVSEEPPPLDGSGSFGDDEDSGVHPALEAIIRRCLAKDPNDRYETIDELDVALCEAQFQLALTGPLPDPMHSSIDRSVDDLPILESLPEVPPAPAPRSRSAFWPVAAVACLLLSLGTVTWAMQKPDAAEALPPPPAASMNPVVVTTPIPMAVPAEPSTDAQADEGPVAVGMAAPKHARSKHAKPRKPRRARRSAPDEGLDEELDDDEVDLPDQPHDDDDAATEALLDKMAVAK